MKQTYRHTLATFFFISCLPLSLSIYAQGTIEDYRRASTLRETYTGKVKNSGLRAHRIADTHRLWYSVFDGTKEVFKEVDADANTVTVLPGNPEPTKKTAYSRHPSTAHCRYSTVTRIYGYDMVVRNGS